MSAKVWNLSQTIQYSSSFYLDSAYFLICAKNTCLSIISVYYNIIFLLYFQFHCLGLPYLYVLLEGMSVVIHHNLVVADIQRNR